MSTQNDYWRECISIAAEECGLTLTPEQLNYVADAVEGGHQHYGMAFYSPPPSDRLNAIEREWKEKLQAARDQHECYARSAEAAVKRVLRLHHSDRVLIGDDGEIHRYG